MKDFAALYDRLDRTNSTNRKVAALVDWFGAADPEDAAHAVALLIGRRPKRLIKVNTLVEWSCETAEVPGWLFGECWSQVGDLAEIVALLVDGMPAVEAEPLSLSEWMQRIRGLRGLEEGEQKLLLTRWLGGLSRLERFLFVKVVTGAFRVGVSQTLVARALSELAELPREVVNARLMGRWKPTADFFASLIAVDEGEVELSRPYPFFLANPLEGEPAEKLGDRGDWQVEWKWDGIRGQLIKRGGQVHLWSRGEELVTERFPEVVEAAQALPDGVVLDGEILGWTDGVPLPFAELQTRINRKKVSKKLQEKVPVVFMAYDLMEHGGEDLRKRPLAERRAALETLPIPTSEVVTAESWAALAALRETSRERGVEGFMLKRLDSPYRSGRKKGDWWKWKIDPLHIDAVMIYAMKGSGRRASRYTDYTFGLWRGDELVTVAKAYTGLTNAEIEELDKWVRQNTVERFGPVRQVPPVHVFELHFDGVQRSKRHKSGLAVRFPRMARWRKDKKPEEADTLEALEAFIRES